MFYADRVGTDDSRSDADDRRRDEQADEHQPRDVARHEERETRHRLGEDHVRRAALEQAIDLMEMGGSSIAKRAAPAIAALLIILFFLRRRRS